MIGLFKIPLISKLLLLIKNFKTRVLADGGTFEAEACLKTSLPTLIQNGPSLVITPNAVKTGKLYSIVPTDGTGDLIVTRATTATRVNSAGLIESVGANIARLDYTNGSCPSILVEPQRTNLLLQSETFTNGWTSEGATISANTITSPDGNLTADTLTEGVMNDVHRIDRNAIVTTAAANYTTSFFVKKNNVRYVRLILTQSGIGSSTIWAGAQFDLDTQSFTSQVGTGGGTFVNATITPFSNGWYRISVTGSIPGTAMIPMLVLSNGSTIISSQSRGCPSYLGNINNKIFIWGAQLELGSNATSYIPTTTATVTRNADVISKTGISSLIGQTEGTLFVDFNYTKTTDVYRRVFVISDNTSNNLISINLTATGSLEVYVINGGVTQVAFLSNILTANTRYKIAVGYVANNAVLYINGTLRNTDLTCTIPTCSGVYLGKVETAGSSGFLNDSINSAMLFKTRLINSQLATLTTP